MKRFEPLFAMFLLFALPRQAVAQLVVEILDAPRSVYSWEPVFVIYEIRNEGSEPVLIPVEGCYEGAELEAAPRGEPLRSHCGIADLRVTKFAWLRPADRRIFFDSIALGPEGLFEIEAVIESQGECAGSLVGPVRLPLPPYREIEGLGQRFTCWSGEVRSPRIVVNVEIPNSDVDRAAAEFLGLPGGVTTNPMGLMFKLRDLLDRFPSSHYTYAALFAGGGAPATIGGVELQPGNPLNGWAVAAYAAWLKGRTRKCASPDSTGLFKPDETNRRLDKALAVHPFPPIAKAYLDQLKLDHAVEECPELQAGPETGGDAGVPQASAQESVASATRSISLQTSQPPQPTPSAPLLSYPPRKGIGTPNMGFRARASLSTASNERIYWLSLPYRYTPADVGTPGVVDAEDLCEDLETDAVLGILRWNEPTSTFIEHTCGSPSPFALVKGTGYGIHIAANYDLDVILSGGHDDAYTFSIPPTGGSQMSWISLPYHLRRTRVNPLPDGFTAEDLCRQIGSTEVRAIVRHDTETGLFHAYVCGSTFQTPFLIQKLQAYGVINKPGQTITWQPEHH